jgi:hypothetical protein
MGSIIKSFVTTCALCIICAACGLKSAKTTGAGDLLNKKTAIERLVKDFKQSGWFKICRSDDGFITVVINSNANSKVMEGYDIQAIFGADAEQSRSLTSTLDKIVKQFNEIGINCIEGMNGTYIDFSDGMTLAIDRNNNRSDLIQIYRAQEIEPGWYYYLNTDK